MKHNDKKMSNMDHSEMDHSKMNHEMHDMGNMDHSKMDHSKMDHEMHDMSNMDHSKMDHSKMNHDMHSMHGMGHNMGGMDHSHMNHGGMSGMEHMGNIKLKVIVSLLLGIPVLILSPMMGLNLPFQFTFPGSEWIVLIFSTILFFYGGWPFLGGAYEELKVGKPAMMTLIAMGISVSYGYSLYAFVNNNLLHSATHVMDFFFELASLIIIMLIGHWIEMNSVMKAGDALSELQKLIPDIAHEVDADGNTKDVAVNDLTKGMNIMIKAGESVPADGKIISGSSRINESLVTGESKAVAKKVNDEVIGGTINGDGTLTVEVTQEQGQGFLAQVSNLVMNAQSAKSKSETMADKVASLLFYFALTIGLIAFFIWLPKSGLSMAASILVTVLVIACPHALGLAIPLVVARSTSISATNGLLIRKRESIEASKEIDTIMFDKTGTLTEGVFTVNKLSSMSSKYTDNEILAIVAGLEKSSSHPIAKSIVEYATKQKVEPAEVTDVQTLKGVGLSGEFNNKTFIIANRKYLADHEINFEQNSYDELAQQGLTVSFVLENDLVVGVIGVGDKVKPSSIKLIKEMQNRNIKTVMLTGDNAETANQIAQSLGIDEVHAELKPADKQEIIKKAQQSGHKVIMVGDGVNDAPSLAMADIGIAIGAGTDVAIDAADVVLVRSNPEDIINFLNLAKATNQKMVQNLWWGAGYNILAIPLAAGILAPFGFLLNPAVGAILMSLSTVIVAINAMTLHLKKI